jgi:hypothetical protein
LEESTSGIRPEKEITFWQRKRPANIDPLGLIQSQEEAHWGQHGTEGIDRDTDQEQVAFIEVNKPSLRFISLHEVRHQGALSGKLAPY